MNETPLNHSAPTYVIVGATGGIGRALSMRLRETGAQLILAGRRQEPLEELGRELGARVIPTDARRFDEVAELLSQAREEFGTIDGIAQLAGSILLKPAHLTSEEEYRDTLQSNLDPAFATVRAGVPALRSSGGSIVLMASAAAEVGLANHEAIAAAKSGIVGLARSAAATYASWGIRVNVVAPGLVETGLSERITSNEASRKASEAMHPLGRLGQPDEIASAIAWLLSREQSWVTGQVLGVDGGLAQVRGKGGR